MYWEGKKQHIYKKKPLRERLYEDAVIAINDDGGAHRERCPV